MTALDPQAPGVGPDGPILDRPLPGWRTVMPVLLAFALLGGLVVLGSWGLHSALALGAWFLAH